MATYLVTGRAYGDWSVTVEADSKEHALEKSDQMMQQPDWCPELENCDDASADDALLLPTPARSSTG